MYHYQRLRDLREDEDMLQKQTAAIIGTSQKQYSRWETGVRQIPFNMVIALAKYYNVSIDYIAELIDTPRPIF